MPTHRATSRRSFSQPSLRFFLAPRLPRTAHSVALGLALRTRCVFIALIGFIALLSLGGGCAPAHAAAYVLPGNLPPGCSASGDGYRCAALTLTANDSLRLATPAATAPITLTVNGDLITSSASINAAGPADALTLVVSGALTVASGATLIANVTAGSVSGGGASGVRFGGTLASSTGGIDLGPSARVAGTLSSASGVIKLGPNSELGGVTSGSAAITLAEFGRVSGAVSSSSGAITIGHDAQISGAVTSTTGAIDIAYGATLGGAVRSTTGALGVGYQGRVSGPISSTSGAIGIGYQSRLDAAVTSGSGPISIGYESTVTACLKSTESAPIALAGGVVAKAVCCGGGGSATCTDACVQNSSRFAMPVLCSAVPSGPHHIELRHGSGSGLTCSPSTLEVVACADAACSALYSGGVSGSLTASSSGSSASANWPDGAGFSIPSGAGSTRVALQLTSLGSVVLGTSGVTPAASLATACNFGAPACSFSAADAGFVFDVADQVADAVQTVSVSAVRKSDRATVCVPAFASVAKSLSFSCAYLNPASGTLAARLRGVALNAANAPAAACDAGGRALTLDFNASGVASVALQYADVGQLQLNARYVGSVGTAGGSDAGLVMTGTATFISAPASFGFSAISAAPLRAGAAFAATVTARNRSGAATPNFGREALAQRVTLGFTRVQPSGAGAANGVFSGSLDGFSAGAASASNLVWSEVGRGDLTATLVSASYLGSSLSATGSSAELRADGAVGRFTPHHFDVVVTPACGVFSYAAQPFAVRVTAMNGLALAGPTVNYDASALTAPNFAQAATLSAAPAPGFASGMGNSLGSLSGNALAASDFRAGVAVAATPAFAFATKLTAAQTLRLRAVDADAISSQGFAEGATALRSGRLRVSNAFGSEKAALAVAVQAQYWSGSAWVLNSADSCSVLPASAVALGGYLDYRGVASSAWSTRASAVTLSAGQGTLTLSAPSPPGPSASGSLDLALNLGASTTDASCLAAHPPSTGAALAWLRSQYGACAGASSFASDPAARAVFGVYGVEKRQTVYVRDIN